MGDGVHEPGARRRVVRAEERDRAKQRGHVLVAQPSHPVAAVDQAQQMPLRSETSGEQRAERRVRTRALAADRRGEQSCDEFELSLELPAAHQIVQTRAEFERGHGLRGLLAMIEELNHVRVERRKRIGELVHAPPVPMQVQDAARMFSVDERERIADSRDHPQELARRLQDGEPMIKEGGM